jgi:hypothetical protein
MRAAQVHTHCPLPGSRSTLDLLLRHLKCPYVRSANPDRNIRPKRFENRHAASVSRPFRPKPTLEDPRAGRQPTATFFPSYEWVRGAIATCA